jgi:hypothetical protein
VIALWRAIAARYRTRAVIAGYDLLNEPSFPVGRQRELVELYVRIATAIRSVDVGHVVFLEGDYAASNFTAFTKTALSTITNKALSFHMYTFAGDFRAVQIASYRQIAENLQVVMWCGEFGEDSYATIEGTLRMLNDPANVIRGGWTTWLWKRAPAPHPNLNVYKFTPAWAKVAGWMNLRHVELMGQSPTAPSHWDFLKPNQQQAQLGMQELIASLAINTTTKDTRLAALYQLYLH